MSNQVAAYSLIVERTLQRRIAPDKIKAQIDHLIARGLNGARGRGWRCQPRALPLTSVGESSWRFRFHLAFSRQHPQQRADAARVSARQWAEIKAVLVEVGGNTRYAGYPWTIAAEAPGLGLPPYTDPLQEANRQAHEVVHELVAAAPALRGRGPATVRSPPPPPTPVDDDRQVLIEESEIRSWADLAVPSGFLGARSDEIITAHENWRHLFGLNAAIRIIWCAIRRAKETNGQCRPHVILHGPPGCGKSTLLEALHKQLGPGIALQIDATNTTKAGLAKLIMQLKKFPPILMIEEIEKANPKDLEILLGMLDERAEVRKVNNNMSTVREVHTLAICSANNKALFDSMMSAGDGKPGALSSRFVNPIHCPRPTPAILRQILLRDIRAFGGKPAWIEPAVALAAKLGISDPRVLQGWLAGGDRLLDGSHQRDLMSVLSAAEAKP